MRIARVLTRLNLGGPARQVLASDPLLTQRGHTVRIFAGTPEVGEGDLFDVLRERGLDVVRVPGLARGVRFTGDLRAARFLREAFTEFAPDLVHTHASKAGVLGRRAARRTRTDGRQLASVHTFHGHVLEGYFPGPVNKLLVGHERRLARTTDRIVAVSHATADDLVRLAVVAEEQLMVIPPGIDLDPLLALEGRSGALRSVLGVGDAHVLVGVVGRLAAVKQPELAIDVFERLAERYPAFDLVFIGDGSERAALERRIAAGPEAVRARVHVVGAHTDMPAVWADLDALLMTSRSEGMPVALIEAAAASRPAVAMDVGGVNEIVAHERTGYLGTDVDELAFGLDRLLGDPAERKALGQRARTRVLARHSAKALADKLEALYETVLETPR